MSRLFADICPSPGERVTILNAPGTPEMRAAFEYLYPIQHEFPPVKKAWMTDLAGYDMFESVASHMLTQIHAGLWKSKKKRKSGRKRNAKTT